MRMTRDEIIAMLMAGAMLYIATETLIWAITGCGILTK